MTSDSIKDQIKKPKMVPVLKKGVITEVEDNPDKVRYEFVSPNQFFSNVINLLPMQNSVTAARAFYEHKFITQALPIKNGESPNVQSLKDADKNESYEDYLGKKTGVVTLDDDEDSADILDVTPDYIKYKNNKGETKTKNLYNNFAFNRKTMLTNYANVKKGQHIERNKDNKQSPILAKTNYTDDNGTLNMGLNARVGMVPYKGWSMDDAVVISEDFAKKLTSQHMYQYNEEDDKNIKTGKNHFKTLYPDKYSKEQLENIDDNGVIKVGSKVNPGDPIIVSTKARTVTSNDANLGRLSKYLKNTRTDASQVWDHSGPGIVTDVTKTRDGYKVNIEADLPTQVGDKLCYHPDTEVFTEKGWKNIKDITFDDKIASLFDRNHNKFIQTLKGFKKAPQDLYAKFTTPYHIMHYYYEGDMYTVEAPRVAYNVTPNHRIWCNSRSSFSHESRWEAKDAQEIYGMSKLFMTSADFDLSERKSPETINIPFIPYKDKKSEKKLSIFDNQTKFNTLDFTLFMAFYLSEGNVHHYEEGSYNIAITQNQKELCKIIESIFKRLNFKYKYVESSHQYIVSYQKSLAVYLKQFGKAQEKFIPEWIKLLPKEYIEQFIAAYFNGDGNKKKAKIIWTTSPKMAQDIAYLFILLGGNPSISKRDIPNYTSVNSRGAIVRQNYPLYEIRFLEFHTASLDNTRKNNFHKIQKYEGNVYCVSVHGLGIILTRYHNKQSWQGNSTRAGNKLTISKIIPMNEMPRTMDGKPLDVLFNQLGLVSRVNANTMYEAMLGKVAEKTGKKYKLPTFNTKDNAKWYDFVENELKKNNLSDVEEVYDPLLDRKLDQPIAVGNAYFLKLHHTSESKISSRGQGIYSQDEQPVKGGEEGMKSKRHSGLENAAILSSGAYNILKDAIHLRGQRNDDYWRKVRMGQTPTLAAKSPFIWDKYLAIMQGSGINTKRTDNGESIQATPFTDKDFDQFNPVEIQNDNIVDFKTMRPLEGGLFDPAMSVANKWGKITLDQHYPNPAFEDTIISLLGIKKSIFNDIMSGKETLRKYGTGPEALYKALKDIDVDRDFEQAKQDFKSGPKSKKQNALNRIMALDGLKRNKMSPEEFMISKVPVLPPKFRPYSIMGDTFLPGDANELYQDVFNMANTQKEIRNELGDEEAIANSDNVYKSLKALYGYGEPNNTKLKQRGVSGFLQKLIGGTSKFSQWNRSVISKPVDFSARSVIDPNPEISMDEMVLPYSMGIEMYAPYIQRELSKRGYSLKESLKHIKDQDKVAREALETVAKDRWVSASRSPAWHKFSYLGFIPKFHDSNNILINPIVNSGLGADYDGDAQLGYVYVCIAHKLK